MKVSKKYKWTVFAINLYTIIIIPILVFLNGMFFLLGFCLAINKYTHQLDEFYNHYIRDEIVLGIIFLFSLIIYFLSRISKKYMNKHYEFSLNNNITSDTLLQTIKNNKYFDKELDLNGVRGIITKKKCFQKSIEYNCYFTLNYETFNNIQYKDDLLKIKKVRKNISDILSKRYNKYDDFQIFVIVFLEKWNKDIEKEINKYTVHNSLGIINFYVIFNNKLLVKPMYFLFEDFCLYGMMNKRLFKIINSIK